MTGDSILGEYLARAAPGLDTTKVSTRTIAFAAALDSVAEVAPDVAASVLAELGAQRRNLKLIASENYASAATLLAMGNWMSDKYAEGVPGHRHYAGCEQVDAIESAAARRARDLFAAQHAYVQPHSGIDANLVAYWALLSWRVEAPALERLEASSLDKLSEEQWEDLRVQLGSQTLLGMGLDAGGHLTHGFRPNISGKLFRHASYGVDPGTGRIDYAEVSRLAKEIQPLVLVAGYSSYPRAIDFAAFRQIADDVGAVLMVDMAHFAGLVAGKVFTGDMEPVAHADIVTTTTHKTLRGPRGGMVLCKKELAPFVDRGCPLVLGGPLPHVMAAKAVALEEASRDSFREYAAKVVENARALADQLQARGLPVLTGGTDNHIVVIDLRGSGLTGRIAEAALVESGVTCNRNPIPQDPQGAWYTSGLRLGTPATTTLGMGTDEMAEVAAIIAGVLTATEPETTLTGANAGSPSRVKYRLDDRARESARARVADLLARHPLYPDVDLGA